MNNQKDTQKTDINSYGQSFVQDIKSLSTKHVFEFANKKTEKLVTALYLVSDCMDTDDALKGKIRLLGVELLSDIYKLSTLSPIEKHEYIAVSLAHIHELLSFIEIAFTIGFISEMNTNILKKEFMLLVSDLKEKETKDKHFSFTLDEKMFDVPPAESYPDIKDKRTSFNTVPARPIGVSFINNKSPIQNIEPRKSNITITNLAERKDRSLKILSLVKDKKEVSIKDISLTFTDCSEKTIQRELNTLVSKGQLKKSGLKRWSRYSVN